MAMDRAHWRAPELGEPHEVQVGNIAIPYFESGEGETVVFVHGALVNANLWRKVVRELSSRCRCITLDLPLGAHSRPLPPGYDITPPALADLIADTIETIGLDEVTLVGNDTGGALSQLVATRRPERLARLVLTSCDAFDNFPPKVMQPAMPLLRRRLAFDAVIAPLWLAPIRHRVMTLIRGTKRPVDPQVSDTYSLPGLRDRAVRGDAHRLLVGLDKRYTLEAAERLRQFNRPALLAWSREDRFFPPSHAERLAELIPDARVELIDDTYTFSPEDQPERLAELIREFVAATAARAAPA